MLRRLRADDLPAFQAYRGDAGLARFQGWTRQSDDEARAFIAAMAAAPLFRAGAWMQLAIASPGADELLGDIGLFLSDDARHAEIGFTLSRAAQGRGLASAAVRAAIDLVFESTQVERVLGITDARNARSIALLQRVGMTLREQREAVFRGEPCVELEFGVERAAWTAPAG